MNKQIAKLLIYWVEVVCSILLYQSNIIPEQHRIDLHNATFELTIEVKKYLES